jgi:ketosteroid isomerase-like protein
MTALFAARVIRVEPDGVSTTGIYQGVDAVREHVRKGRGTWAEGRCDPERYLVHEDKVVVYLHARVRLASNDEWIDGRFADGFVLEDGKIVEYRTFRERKEALAWAGITAEDLNPNVS